MKTDLFQSCGRWWVFQICWHTECIIFTTSSFRIWNSSTGIPSPPLALFIVMLPKAHLTSRFRMSGSRWVRIPSWLPGLWRSFLYSSSVYSCHLFLICSPSVRSIPFLSFIVPIFPGGSYGKSVCLQGGRPGFSPWRRKWQPTPLLLPGESHGWRSLMGYSPWSRKELDTTERLHFLFLSLHEMFPQYL